MGFLAMLSVAGLMGCAAQTDDGTEDPIADELKKKVKPKAGNGAFDLDQPVWSTTGFVGDYQAGYKTIKPGERAELSPGNYSLAILNTDLGSGIHGVGGSVPFTIAPGVIVSRKASGLRIRYAQTPTLGTNNVRFGVPGYESGYLDTTGAWIKQPNGASMFMVEGKYRVILSSDPAPIDFTLAAGDLKEIVLPTAKVNLALDAYDPAYPTPPQCTPTELIAGSDPRNASVRNPNGTPNATFVVPAGPKAPVAINTYGFRTTLPTTTPTVNITLNRLEIDDLEVTGVNGTKSYKGSFRLERRENGNWVPSPACTIGMPTHSGIDVPDGDYRITTTATTPSGTSTSVEEVSFP
jgi:hypothetical protein